MGHVQDVLNKNEWSKQASNTIDTLHSVKCCKCGVLHDISNDTFVTVYGNVCIGTNGGMIGNNLDSDMKVRRATVYCLSCFKSWIKEWGND